MTAQERIDLVNQLDAKCKEDNLNDVSMRCLVAVLTDEDLINFAENFMKND